MIRVKKNTISVMKVEKSASDAAGTEAVSYAGLRLCYVLHGSAQWQINERMYSVSAGDIILLSDRQKRRLRHFRSTDTPLSAQAIFRFISPASASETVFCKTKYFRKF